jgi:heme A synthase
MHDDDDSETVIITVTVGSFTVLLTVGSSCRDKRLCHTELTVVRATTIFDYLITMQNLTVSRSSQTIDFALRFASLTVFPVIPIKKRR